MLRGDPMRSSPRDQDPLRLLQIAVGLILGMGTTLSLVLWATGIEPRALRLAGLLWALYGFVTAVIDGVLDPAIEFAARLLQHVGIGQPDGGYSAIETLVARGHHLAAANAYLERAREGAGDTTALIRRAFLLAGPLGAAQAGVAELLNWRASRRLTKEEDVQVGLALAELYERHLAEPGRAMTELRRLLELHPGVRSARRIRRALAMLREARFGTGEPGS